MTTKRTLLAAGDQRITVLGAALTGELLPVAIHLHPCDPHR